MEWIVALLAAALLTGSAAAGIGIYMRRKYIAFTDQVCRSIDEILSGNGTGRFDVDDETLLSKLQMKLKRLEEITAAVARENEKQKLEVQGVVADISHQLKTPVANVVMYCDTAMNPALSDEERERCMKILKGQVDKLEFLIQSLIRMSRLEQNIIRLNPERTSLRGMLDEATESIAGKASAKGMEIKLVCPRECFVYCDLRWTLEAVLNVLDNAVKYSDEGGEISIEAQPFEIYTRIQITDNGIGISSEHVTDVCRRFFREGRGNRTEGLGIGLYLTREILEKEQGYMKIRSEIDEGTEVSLYLLNFMK